ncbi:MAG: hypothetical protein LBR72_02675 [Oscillospiraceae bacterium]|jgi:hypothetical protein|nr:hypothetical protein [Oscillospiraceae bacterium]
MKATEYVEEVMRHVDAEEPVKRRLSEDLIRHIEEAGGEAAIARMGDPKEMAAELMDSLYSDRSEMIQELVRMKKTVRRRGGNYEYVSKRKLFGLPLVHVRLKRDSFFKPAKGVFALGFTSVGIFSLGILSLGMISFGVFALGLLLAFGAVAAGVFALGGVAVGMLACGGIALGTYAFGGVSIASRVAVGGYASAPVAIGGMAKGTFTIATGGTSLNFAEISQKTAQALIHSMYPDINGFILRLLTGMFG